MRWGQEDQVVSSKTSKYKIRNEVLRDTPGVASIEDKMSKTVKMVWPHTLETPF